MCEDNSPHYGQGGIYHIRIEEAWALVHGLGELGVLAVQSPSTHLSRFNKHCFFKYPPTARISRTSELLLLSIIIFVWNAKQRFKIWRTIILLVCLSQHVKHTSCIYMPRNYWPLLLRPVDKWILTWKTVAIYLVASITRTFLSPGWDSRLILT